MGVRSSTTSNRASNGVRSSTTSNSNARASNVETDDKLDNHFKTIETKLDTIETILKQIQAKYE